MKRIKTIYDTVLFFLREDPNTRDSDRFLILMVYAGLGIDVSRPFADILLDNNAPSMESIRRARQKAQQMHPELSASKDVEKVRLDNAKRTRAWAISGGK